MAKTYRNEDGEEFTPEFAPVTVQELIAILSKMPQDALVMVNDHSEYFALKAEDVVSSIFSVDCGDGDSFQGPIVHITTRD